MSAVGRIIPPCLFNFEWIPIYRLFILNNYLKMIKPVVGGTDFPDFRWNI